jgi:hypothetical protein|tara:strand:- start:254 stop:550 length:297 start_codon:yes stop_codon:yes gene_type:complete
MGYLKYDLVDASSGVKVDGLIPTENFVRCFLSTGTILIQYGSGYELLLADTTPDLDQDDVNAIINGINTLNGSSGSSIDIDLKVNDNVNAVTVRKGWT